MNYYLGEIRLFPVDAIPDGWLPCDGRIINALDNPVLNVVIGNTYGGSPGTTFALPDYRGRVPIGQGQNAAISANFTLGQAGGAESQTLSGPPPHTHQVYFVHSGGVSASGEITFPAELINNGPETYYANSANITLAPDMVTDWGAPAPAPINNMQQWIGLVFCIAATGGSLPPRP